jgi:class 3 adenylate cyclase
MTTILIVEEDEAIRSQIVRLLQLQGYDALEAADGPTGLDQARRHRPDLVLCEVGIPRIDGFQLVQAIRADPTLAATPVMLLTALHDRASMRRAVRAGADDILWKPLAPAELLEALSHLLQKSARLAEHIEAAVQARQIDATVLFADIRNFTALAEMLGSGEVAELLSAYFEHSCPPVLGNGGRHLKFMGDGLMSLFVDDDQASAATPAARRAVSAALGIAVATHEFRSWVERRFAGRGLPPFAIGIGLHAGEVTLCRLGPPGRMEITPIGDTVNVAARVEAASKELGWTVVASAAVLQRAGSTVQRGGAASLSLRGRTEEVEVAEITGLADAAGASRHGVTAPVQRAEEVHTAVQVNASLAATAPEGSPVTVLPDAKRQLRD